MSNMIYTFHSPAQGHPDQAEWEVEYYINGVAFFPPFRVGFDVDFDLPHSSAGQHGFEHGRTVVARLWAVDAAGNKSGSAQDFTFNVTDDIAPPQPPSAPVFVSRREA